MPEKDSKSGFCLNATMASMDGTSRTNAGDDLIDLVRFTGQVLKSINNWIGNVDIIEER